MKTPYRNVRYRIYYRDDWKCVYCGASLREGDATLDHFIPRSKGGTNKSTNLVSSCVRCNSSKSDMAAREFLVLVLGLTDEWAELIMSEVRRKRKKRLRDHNFQERTVVYAAHQED